MAQMVALTCQHQNSTVAVINIDEDESVTGVDAEDVAQQSEDEDDNLVHENTSEAKEAWEKKLGAYFGFDINVKVHCAFHDNSMPNLIQHVCSCKDPDDDNEPQLAKHVKWVVQHHCPYAIVKDEVYLEILCMFNKDVKAFSADTLSCDVKDMYSMVKLQVATMLQNVRGCIHIAQDGWAAPQKKSLLRLVAVWVANGKMQVLTLDMVHLKSHTGLNLAETICKTLCEFGIIDKLLSLPGDNTLSNVTMACCLKRPWQASQQPHCWSHNLCHVC
ncbi:uncharacterized protein ARMOST_12665 [Armillaria ostoyae]|uniref:DUF659 domain-containing protein n=1 Tax=Armillaria ostoyae TaxID=47428 RepID=A0A284RKJ7_ARMOS|nr:uncharacterized protein ARMOST_12665 [Armillaria ostoyae]